MTPTPDTALDAQCVALLGWRRAKPGAISGVVGAEYGCYWYDADGTAQRACITDAFANMQAFSPSSIEADAKLLEDAIERAGEWKAYAVHLMERVDAVPFDDALWIWQALRASPAQRARAFVDAMEAAL